MAIYVVVGEYSDGLLDGWSTLDKIFNRREKAEEYVKEQTESFMSTRYRIKELYEEFPTSRHLMKLERMLMKIPEGMRIEKHRLIY